MNIINSSSTAPMAIDLQRDAHTAAGILTTMAQGSQRQANEKSAAALGPPATSSPPQGLRTINKLKVQYKENKKEITQNADLKRLNELFSQNVPFTCLPVTKEEAYNHNPGFTLSYVLQDFGSTNAVKALNTFFNQIKEWSRVPDSHPRSTLSRLINDHLDAAAQLTGYIRCEFFLQNPESHGKLLANEPSFAVDSLIWKNKSLKCASLIIESTDLLRKLVYRIDQVRLMLKEKQRPFDSDFVLKVIHKDFDWQKQTTELHAKAEKTILEVLKVDITAMKLLEQNQEALKAYLKTKVQKYDIFLKEYGIQWRHSSIVRKRIEAAGFKYSPTMLKVDRCICSTCGEIIFGLHSWDDPATKHNMKLPHTAGATTSSASLTSVAGGIQAMDISLPGASSARAAAPANPPSAPQSRPSFGFGPTSGQKPSGLNWR